MATVLYPSPVFGPIHSRRLGKSLGVNLMPSDGKLCSFDCIYCECGYNKDNPVKSPRPTQEEVMDKLESTLITMKEKDDLPDYITFAGNGEPTLHPKFAEIIEDTIHLRNIHTPKTKIAVLTNGSMIHRKNVFDALMVVDENIVKLDTADIKYIKKVNRPVLWYNVDEQISRLVKFQGHCIIQTMFMHGIVEGEDISNFKAEYIQPWLRALRIIKPSQVMVYTIDRDTPEKDIYKVSPEELDEISRQVEPLGIHAISAY